MNILLQISTCFEFLSINGSRIVLIIASKCPLPVSYKLPQSKELVELDCTWIILIKHTLREKQTKNINLENVQIPFLWGNLATS